MDQKTIFQGQDQNEPVLNTPNIQNQPLQQPEPVIPQQTTQQSVPVSPPEFQPFSTIPTSPPIEPVMEPPMESLIQSPVEPLIEQPVQPPIQPPTGEEMGEKRGGFNLKKLVSIFVGLLVLILLIFGIASLWQRFQSGGNEKVTLEYWGLWEDSKAMNLVISDFKRENPNITVNYTKHDIKDYRQKLVNRIENKTGPDIFRFHNSWPIMLSSYLLPIPTDVISPNDFKAAFYPVIQKDLIKNGAIYGIPLEIDTLALYINTDLFNAAGIGTPTKWEDFASVSAALTVKDSEGKIKTAGVALGTANNVNHASDIISLLFAQNGVDLENISSNQQNLSQALQYYTSFVSSDANVWDKDQDTSLLAFSKGNLGMYFGYSYDYFSIKALSPSLNFKIVPVPKLAGKSLTIASYWAEGVSVKSKHQKEALLFLKYLTKKETMQKLYSEEAKTRLFGEPYSRVDLADSLKQNTIVYPFLEQAPSAKSTLFSDATYDQGINEELKTYLYSAVDSILNDNTSPESAAETLSKGFTQTLVKYGR